MKKSSRDCAARALLVLYFALQPGATTADSGNVEDILPLANDPNDPIGIERDPGFERAAAARDPRSGPAPLSDEERARFGPTPPPFAAKSGEALTAVASVRERSHRVSLELVAGLALVEAELSFENGVEKPAEIEYRLAVPAGAALAGLEVCNARGCRNGTLVASGERAAPYDEAVHARGPRPPNQQLPAAQAHLLRDSRGHAIVVRAASVERADPLSVRVRYVADAPVHGGVARLRLPARGMDPRVAELELSLRASDLAEVRAGSQVLRVGSPGFKSDPWQAVEVRAQVGTAATRSVWHFPCGGRTCARAYATAPPRMAAAVDLVLAIDASPSTEGSARSRLVPTIAAILARAPQGSRVRALRFASRAEALVAERKDPSQLSLSAFAPVAFEAELGSATRFEAAWEMVRGWGVERGKTLIVLVGDGGITRGKARPFEAARRAGVEVSVVNVADRTCQAPLAQTAHSAGGTVIDAGAEADDAVRGGSPDRLEERLAALFAPVIVERPSVSSTSTAKLPPLRAGESVSLEGPARGAWTLRAGSSVRATAAPERLALALGLRAAKRAPSDHAPEVAADYLLAVDPRDLVVRSDRPSVQRGGSCDRRGPALRQSGLSSDAKPVALAAERVCAVALKRKPAPTQPAEGSTVGEGMPSSPLLGMLRQRVIPVARGCFRRDRAGRADYQVRAVFAFELAEREVVSAEVTGQISETLRSCLLEAVDQLAVPRFSGRVVVRYPLATERETLPSQIELTPRTAERLDAVLGPD